MIKDANSLIYCFDAGKLLRHGFLLFLTNRYEYRPNHHAVGAHRVALLLISSGRASMVMRHQGTVRENDLGCRWEAENQIRQETRHTLGVCFTAKPWRKFQNMFQQLQTWLRSKVLRNRAVLPWTPGAVWTLYSV